MTTVSGIDHHAYQIHIGTVVGIRIQQHTGHSMHIRAVVWGAYTLGHSMPWFDAG